MESKMAEERKLLYFSIKTVLSPYFELDILNFHFALSPTNYTAGCVWANLSRKRFRNTLYLIDL